MILSACAGQPLAVAQLTQRLRPRLSRMAQYYARCTGEDRDDLLQEAWQAVLEHLPALDPTIGCPLQHLIKRARWRILTYVRAARLRRCQPLPDALPQLAAGAACGLSMVVVLNLDLADFHASLCATQQAVLTALLSGMTWRQVAQVLGCTSPNIAYHVRQIRKRYRQWDAGQDGSRASA
jgi:DNA-directed RNA polymerase specialized sigma24 family protein